MKDVVLKFGIICWGFIVVFVAVLLFAMAIPESAVLYVATGAGLAILGWIGARLRRTYRTEGFDFGWFLAVQKGYWQILFILFGLILFAGGLFGLLLPDLAGQLAEQHWLKFASVLVVLFWLALTSTFLSWSLVCFGEAVVYGRARRLKTAIGGFGLGVLWLLFAVLFLSLFLDVVDDNFVAVPAVAQNWFLGIFAVLFVGLGLWSGKYDELKVPENEEESTK